MTRPGAKYDAAANYQRITDPLQTPPPWPPLPWPPLDSPDDPEPLVSDGARVAFCACQLCASLRLEVEP